jgi:hypothetical protein
MKADSSKHGTLASLKHLQTPNALRSTVLQHPTPVFGRLTLLLLVRLTVPLSYALGPFRILKCPTVNLFQ